MTEYDKIELDEVLTVCRQRGYADLIDLLLDHDSYTKLGRINKSQILRQLKQDDDEVTPQILSQRLDDLKELMGGLGL